MLNNEKIILMTKLALYEQGEGKSTIPTGKYYKSDYVGMRLLSSFVYINIALIIIAGLVFLSDSETVLQLFTGGRWLPMLMSMAVVYIAAVAFYLIVSYIFFTYKYKKTRRSLKEYNAKLKQLHKIQDVELEAYLNETETEIETEMEINMEGEEE